jgi:hypothetical protein
VCGSDQAILFLLIFALSHVFRVSFVCSLALVHAFRGACVLVVLFALSCVFRVRFVCCLSLVHMFRGELVSCVLFCSFCCELGGLPFGLGLSFLVAYL